MKGIHYESFPNNNENDYIGNADSGVMMDAEEGVASGRYAAYIFIPETFSASVQGRGKMPDPYMEQGEGQPFGYTGYGYDRTGGTYFAQAREYQPETGRFTAEDVIKGNGAYPETLNSYAYCMGNPMSYVDLNGENPEDYEYIYYINNPDAAVIFGHTAFLLVKENEMAEYYSYSTKKGDDFCKLLDIPDKNAIVEFEGQLFTHMEKIVMFQQKLVLRNLLNMGM